MSLIAGVGDEVVQFVGVVLVLTVTAIAWWSTNARPDRYRTVLVMRSRPQHPVTVRIRTRPNMVVGTSQTNVQVTDTTGTSNENTETSQQSQVIPLQEMDSIIDADMAMLDNHRLHFYRRMDSSPGTPTADDSEMQQESETASTEQMREMDSIVNAMEADITRDCNVSRNPVTNAQILQVPTEELSSKPEESKCEKMSSEINATVLSENVNIESPMEGTASQVNTEDEGNKILIKLKYLNETCREVEGNLDELLKDFKWRHFARDLERLRRVRLIFNGRVLEEEASTLRACGLHNRAVVHALVHQPITQRNPDQDTPVNAVRNNAGEYTPAEQTWDFESVWMTLISIALTIFWFCRCQYSNMFTTSASVALFGLTLFYSVAIFGLYLSDSYHLDRRQQRPVPAE